MIERMCRLHEYIFYLLVILARETVAFQSLPSVKLQSVSRQLHCDVINSYQTSSFTKCASKCLENIESCEGIALGKNSICQVCSVKAVVTPMEQFTTPFGDFKIYIRVIHMDKGNHVGNQTSHMLYKDKNMQLPLPKELPLNQRSLKYCVWWLLRNFKVVRLPFRPSHWRIMVIILMTLIQNTLGFGSAISKSVLEIWK